MNELIKKLLIETIGKERLVESRAFDHYWALSDEELEKFAYLILQECTGLCQELAADYAAVANSEFVTEGGKTLHNGMWGGAANCAREIKQHFEIE